jgi:hypothetical protein
MRRVEHVIDQSKGRLGRLAGDLLDRHGYRASADGGGPHRNVLGHPLFELPVWLAGIPSDYLGVSDEALNDICESSLFGYLSVRVDDDYFDGHWDDPHAAMMLSSFFRSRHLGLLAPLVDDRRFWERCATVWTAYAEAMLVERSLHHPESEYGPRQFETVLDRSQPLEIPGDAVLSMKGQWDSSGAFGALVRHLTRATQLFDDFVDAPDDLAAGNFTWMVRRLGGQDGESALRRGMVRSWDSVREEVELALAEAQRIAASLGILGMSEWVEERRGVISHASDEMYLTLFNNIGWEDDPGGEA